MAAACGLLLLPLPPRLDPRPRSISGQLRRRGGLSVAGQRPLHVSCSATADDSTGGLPHASYWASKIIGASPDKIFRLISGVASGSISQFVDSPRTFLHNVDPRVKSIWLLVLVVLPARSHLYMRCLLVFQLSLMSMCILPRNVWMDQLGRVAVLSGILFIMLGFGSDGVPLAVQSRTPPTSITGLGTLPSSLSGYSYVIMKFGPLQFTRKGLSVASTSACLTFVIFQSASLLLATTTPEQLAFVLQWFMHPLRPIGIPVSDTILTLLLSLRFINIVFDEVRNAALGIITRRINWRLLSSLETLNIFVAYVQRIFRNIFNHSEKITEAMIARGFQGDCDTHKIYLPEPSLRLVDLFSLLYLLTLVGLATLSERLV